MEDRKKRLDLEDKYETMMRNKVPDFNVSSCSKLSDEKDKYKCYIKMGMAFSKEMTRLLDFYRPKCKTIEDPLEKRTCTWAINRVFNGEKYDVNQSIKLWRSYLNSRTEGNKMQSIKTILMFEVMYRHKVLGLPLSEIENELKNYPTQDAQDLLNRLRRELSTDTLSRNPDGNGEDDVSVTEAQEQGDKAEYQAHFNKMLKDYGVTNIGELPSDKRAEFFKKIDQHWKGDKEKKVKEEIEWTDEIFEEFVQEFSEFADILTLIKREMQVLDEASKRTTMTKITRQTKIDRTIGNLAMQLAKAKNDPLYKKFKKFKDKWMKFKERIQQKYKARVRTAARQGGGVGHLLKNEKKQKEKQQKKK